MTAFINSLRREVTDLITGNNPIYKVTKEGRVYKRNGQEFEYNIRSGYLSIILSNDDEQYQVKVHRLVAYLYCPNYSKDNLNVVDHIDGNKLNNHYSNLEWVTSSENQRRAIKSGLRTFDSISGESHYLATFTEAQLRECLSNPAFSPTMRLKDFRLIVAPLNLADKQVDNLLYGKSWHSVTKDYGIVNRNTIPLSERTVDKSKKLTVNQVYEIHNHFFDGKSDRKIAALYGVSNVLISNIRSGKVWTHIKPDKKFPTINDRRSLTVEKLKQIQLDILNNKSTIDIVNSYNISKATVIKIKNNNLPKYLVS